MAAVDTSLPPETSGAAAELAAAHSAEHPLKLYGGWFCPFVQRAWITLCEKSIPHQYIEVNPYKKEASFLAMNPRGLVPTLAVPAGPSGELKPLYESAVICEYLEDAYGDKQKHGHHLLPQDPYARARARLWIDHINTKIIPGFYKLLQHTEDKPYSTEQARSELLDNIKKLAEQMDAEGGPWFLGKEISLVDISLAPWAARLWLIDHYKNGGVGVPKEAGDASDATWKRWNKWFEAITSRQSVRDTLSSSERYIIAYKRYADDTTNSLVGQATRTGQRLP